MWDFFNNCVLERSGVAEDENYQKYQEYCTAGELTEDGYYLEKTAQSVDHSGKVRITFASNNNLEIQYYKDSEHLIPADAADCYVDPGDSLYAIVSIRTEMANKMYSFSDFHIYGYDSEGKRQQLDSVPVEQLGEQYRITIPENFTGTGISVEPVGEYQKRVITLNDYYMNENEDRQFLAGTWTVNDREYTGDFAEISPISSYVISYKFDSDEYFFQSSSPECYYSSNMDGVVIFNQRNAEDETETYSVELRKYFTVAVVSDRARSVRVDDGEWQSLDANEELSMDHLKYGDVRTIETDQAWPTLENNQELLLTSSEKISADLYRYKVAVPEADGTFSFDPADYQYEHGTIRFQCLGGTVTTRQLLAKGRKIYYEQETAEQGYWLAGDEKEHYIVVGEEEETRAALEAIHFTPRVAVNVSLPQPEAGGTVIYTLDGKELDGTSAETYSGAEITMQFQPWEGWIGPSGEKKYAVNGDSEQVITVNENGRPVPVTEIFREDEGHKPELTLSLEKSVGTEMTFALTASGYAKREMKYGDAGGVTGILSSTAQVISKEKIGTDQPIQLTMSNRAIQSGMAVRIRIILTDTDKNKTTEVRYIENLSDAVAPIAIYSPGMNAVSEKWYASIDITVGVVDVERFISPKASANTIVTVRNADTNAVLTDGTLLEESQKVYLSISPKSGYYVTGEKTRDDAYTASLTYDEYCRKIENLIAEHPAARYYTIQLDTSDVFADYDYKLDGEAVSGTVKVKEGQKLELTYEITDSSYHLTESHGGIPLLGWGSTDKKVTETITMTSIVDGAVITKADFGIEAGKGN